MKTIERINKFLENCMVYFASIEISGYTVKEFDPKFEKEFRFLMKNYDPMQIILIGEKK